MEFKYIWTCAWTIKYEIVYNLNKLHGHEGNFELIKSVVNNKNNSTTEIEIDKLNDVRGISTKGLYSSLSFSVYNCVLGTSTCVCVCACVRVCVYGCLYLISTIAYAVGLILQNPYSLHN